MLILLFLLVLGAPAGFAAQDTWTGVHKVVAIGDVHGDYRALVETLHTAGLVDRNERWAGGDTHLVQTGDLLDRGGESRKVMDLLMDLQKQADKAGGAVHVLLGNHEAMNIYGDLRYVSAGEYAAFKTSNSERLLALQWERDISALPRKPTPDEKEKWEEEHPLGWVEHRMAFSEEGKYGKWLRNLPAVIKVNDSIFLHGGISPRFVSKSISDINSEVAAGLKDLSKLTQDGAVLAPDGPLWYRGLAQESEATIAPLVADILKNYEVNRVVIGHTPTPGSVITRMNGKVVMIDAGMSEYFGSHRSFLLIDNQQLYAVHRGDKVLLPKDGLMDVVRYLKQVIALEPGPTPLTAFLRNLQSAPAQ
jgi:hypothetical protein